QAPLRSGLKDPEPGRSGPSRHEFRRLCGSGFPSTHCRSYFPAEVLYLFVFLQFRTQTAAHFRWKCSIDPIMKILVIEDDREAAQYIEKAFQEVGHTAHVVHDGETGYGVAEAGDYDVLVVDRMLPHRDGL